MASTPMTDAERERIIAAVDAAGDPPRKSPDECLEYAQHFLDRGQLGLARMWKEQALLARMVDSLDGDEEDATLTLIQGGRDA